MNQCIRTSPLVFSDCWGSEELMLTSFKRVRKARVYYFMSILLLCALESQNVWEPMVPLEALKTIMINGH